MGKLTMNYTFKKGKYANKTVGELTEIKGTIFSMIKEGYEFEDDVLAAAHIKKNIRDQKIYLRVGDCFESGKTNKPLAVETASLKKILSELNTLDKVGENIEENDDSENINIDEI